MTRPAAPARFHAAARGAALVLAFALPWTGVARADGPAEAPPALPLPVRIDLKVEVEGDTFLEGQTVAVRLTVANRSDVAVLLLSAAANGNGLGTRVPFAHPLEAFDLEETGETVRVRTMPATAAEATGPRPVASYLRPRQVLGPGETMSGTYPRKIFEVPRSVLDYMVLYVRADTAIAAGYVYLPATGRGGRAGEDTYLRASGAGAAVAELRRGLLRVAAMPPPCAAHAVAVLEPVGRRPFSFEQAQTRVQGALGPYTYLTSDAAWVFECADGTHFLCAGGDVRCPGRHVRLVERVEIEGVPTLALWNYRADADTETRCAGFLSEVRGLGVRTVARGKSLDLEVPAAALLSFLKAAAAHGVKIEGDAWEAGGEGEQKGKHGEGERR